MCLSLQQLQRELHPLQREGEKRSSAQVPVPFVVVFVFVALACVRVSVLAEPTDGTDGAGATNAF